VLGRPPELDASSTRSPYRGGVTQDFLSPAGLCARCRHARVVVSRRGSRFVLCELSRTDTRFPRYPSLPVISCAGFSPLLTVDEPPALDAPKGGA